MPLVALLAAACGAPVEDDASRFAPLVELEDWVEVPRDEDPFVTDLESAPPCEGPAFEVESQWLEIDTGRCGFVTVRAPARRAVPRGHELAITVSHFDLAAPLPAQGEVQLMFGRCEAWSKLVEIPSAAAVYSETLAAACSLSVGDDVYFHLHNHGQNNWQLRELSVRP